MDAGAEGSNMIFMAGQSIPDPLNGGAFYAAVACVSMQDDLVLMKEHWFVNKRYIGATQIKRFKPNVNEFVLAVQQRVIIIEFFNNQFSVLMEYDPVHAGVIDDIAVFRNVIYTVARTEKNLNQVVIQNYE